MEQDAGRTAASLIDRSELHIAQYSGKHENRGDIYKVGMKAGHNLRRDCIHNITYQHDRSDERDGLADEGRTVHIYIMAHLFARSLIDETVIASLAQRKEEGEQECHDYDPVAYGDRGGRASGGYAQHKTERDNYDIHDGDALQPEAIGDVKQYV